MIKRFILISGISLMLWACPFSKETPPTDPTTIVENNIPVTVSDTDKFTFEIQADTYSMDKTTPVDFSTGQLLMVSTINRQGGDGSITFLDKDSTGLQTVDLGSSQISTKRLSLSTNPATIRIRLSNFSGNISFVLKKQ